MANFNKKISERMIALRPELRRFAISLCGNVERADDLVQETCLRGIACIDQFKSGTNLAAWLFTIQRNLYRSQYKKNKRMVEDVDGRHAATFITFPHQEAEVELRDFPAAFEQLPPEQREAIMLVGISGFAYEEAAVICGCPCGTIKSRVNRARAFLKKKLGIDKGEPVFEHARPSY